MIIFSTRLLWCRQCEHVHSFSVDLFFYFSLFFLLILLDRRVGNELLRTYFPRVAEFYKEVGEFWEKKTHGEVKMPFGHYFTLAINFPMTREVKSTVHLDKMNFAAGPCGIMPFGELIHVIRHYELIYHIILARFLPVSRQDMVCEP